MTNARGITPCGSKFTCKPLGMTLNTFFDKKNSNSKEIGCDYIFIDR